MKGAQGGLARTKNEEQKEGENMVVRSVRRVECCRSRWKWKGCLGRQANWVVALVASDVAGTGCVHFVLLRMPMVVTAYDGVTGCQSAYEE